MVYEPNRWLKERDAYWNTIQIVHPGETFPLFHLARSGTTIRYADDGSFGAIASRIRLQIGHFDPLNISIATAPYALQRAAVITPFDRNQGYPLDQVDLRLRNRYEKVASMNRELAKIVEGMGLVVFVAFEDLPLYSMLRSLQENGSSLLSQEIISLLEHVFLTLTFPGGSSFSARALYNSNRLFLLFRTFFPTDTGPLPVGDPVPTELGPLSIEEGFRVLLPFDLEQVQTIRAKFLLLPSLDDYRASQTSL